MIAGRSTEHAFYLDAWNYGCNRYGEGCFTITRKDWDTWVCTLTVLAD